MQVWGIRIGCVGIVAMGLRDGYERVWRGTQTLRRTPAASSSQHASGLDQTSIQTALQLQMVCG